MSHKARRRPSWKKRAPLPRCLFLNIEGTNIYVAHDALEQFTAGLRERMERDGPERVERILRQMCGEPVDIE